MKKQKKLLSIVLISLTTVAMLAGCSNGKAVPNVETGEKTSFILGDTTFNPENEEKDVNPHNAYSGWACIRYGIGETLFRYSDTMEIEPWLATEYKNIDELTWEITLRDHVKFTSGRIMDAEAVKQCLEHLVSVHDRAPGDLSIDTMTADGQVLTIKTTEPKPAFINYLCDPYGCIIDIDAGILEDGNVSATGPYIATEIHSGDHLSLVRNDNYWEKKPGFEKITVRTISDGDTLTMALQSGEIDAAYGLPYASYPLFENDNYTFSSTPTSRAFYAWMNFESPITQDLAVRKAIAMGIDKESFVNVLLKGCGYPAVGVFPNTFSFGGDQVKTESYDADAAKALLEEAGWIDLDGDGIREKDGTKLQIRWLTYPSRQELPLLAEAAQATLKEIGIDVVINSTADHNSIRKDPSAWDVYASAMVTAPTGDPQYFFTTCSLDSSVVNNGHYHSDKLEALASELEKTFEDTRRGALAVEMQQTILDDNAYVFISHLKMSMVSSAKVTGLVAHPCDYYEITANLKPVQ